MSSIGSMSSRTSMLQSGQQLLTSLRRSQNELLRLQQQISTGKLVSRPSDAPEKTAAILALRSKLSQRDQHEKNLQYTLGILNVTDNALGDISDLLLEAKSVASSQIGIGSSTETRANQSTVIDGQLQALLEITNRRFQDVPLFAGNQFRDGQDRVFADLFGGITYTGSATELEGNVGLLNSVGLTTNGVSAFGSLSARVKSKTDLDPQLTLNTRLDDLTGAPTPGSVGSIRRSAVYVTVGGTQVTVELNDAATAGDVVTRVNAAIDSVAPGAGQLSISGAGFALTSSGPTITISDPNTGQAAADLGIDITASGGTVAGGDVNRKLSLSTELSAIGAGVDLASGLTLTQGNVTKVADFSGAQTVQDLVNIVDQLNLGLRLEVNANGTGLDLVTSVSGANLSIRENGGSTAADLGLLSFGPDTKLSELNHNIGVNSVAGEDDFAVELHDGSRFTVNIDGVVTIGELIAKVEQSATDQGVTVPGSFSIALGNGGLVLTDNTAGGSDFRVVPVGASTAADSLGFMTSAGAGNTISGEDVATVRVESLFTHLMQLRDALANDDERGITFAATAIESDIDAVSRIRADVGVRAQRIEQQQTRNSELGLLDQGLLSDLQDADLTEVITRFTQMQQQLQASLQVGASQLQLSLLDFLR